MLAGSSRRGAARVYAIDTGYGVLAYRLRTDPRVVVMERTNAMHVLLPEPVDLVTIDVAWTPQQRILPAARNLLKPGGQIVTLIKPQYEADRRIVRGGLLPLEQVRAVVDPVLAALQSDGFEAAVIESPIPGQKGIVEYLARLVARPA